MIQLNCKKFLLVKRTLNNLKIKQIYMLLIYFYRRLSENETIYVEFPSRYFGWEENLFALLNSTLYKLKQSARV